MNPRLGSKREVLYRRSLSPASPLPSRWRESPSAPGIFRLLAVFMAPASTTQNRGGCFKSRADLLFSMPFALTPRPLPPGEGEPHSVLRPGGAHSNVRHAPTTPKTRRRGDGGNALLLPRDHGGFARASGMKPFSELGAADGVHDAGARRQTRARELTRFFGV